MSPIHFEHPVVHLWGKEEKLPSNLWWCQSQTMFWGRPTPHQPACFFPAKFCTLRLIPIFGWMVWGKNLFTSGVCNSLIGLQERKSCLENDVGCEEAIATLYLNLFFCNQNYTVGHFVKIKEHKKPTTLSFSLLMLHSSEIRGLRST